MSNEIEFKNFWSKKINYINNIQINYNIEQTKFSKFKNIEFYNLTFNSYDNSKIYAKYIKNIKFRTKYPNRPIPILFYFHGYPASSRNWLEKSAFSSLGYDVVAIDFRNQGGLSKDKKLLFLSQLYIGQLKGCFTVKYRVQKLTIDGMIRELSNKEISVKTSDGYRRVQIEDILQI